MLGGQSLLGALVDLLQGGGTRREPPDPRQRLYIALARVLSAAAWVDGPMRRIEENVIKALVAPLRPRLTSRETKGLLLDLEAPVSEETWRALLEALQKRVRRRTDAEFTVGQVRNLLQSDGRLVDEERRVLADVQVVLRSTSIGPEPPEPPRPPQHAATGAESEAETGGHSLSLGDAAAPLPTAMTPGNEVLVVVLEQLRGNSDERVGALRQEGAPLEKLCAFSAALGYVLGRSDLVSDRVQRQLTDSLASLFALPPRAASLVLGAGLRVAGGDARLEAVVAELADWSSPVEYAWITEALAGLDLRPEAAGRRRELADALTPEGPPR